jgi:pyruvate dehydrogenase (quinone)/pyruvate oxidase
VLGAPIIKSLSGKMVVGDDSPYCTGGLGLLGTAPSEELVSGIEALLMLGTNFPYTKFLRSRARPRWSRSTSSRPGPAPGLATDVPLVGDVGATLEALLPLCIRKDRKHLETYQKKVRDWNGAMAALESPDREPIAPQYLAAQLDALAADDAVLTC